MTWIDKEIQKNEEMRIERERRIREKEARKKKLRDLYVTKVLSCKAKIEKLVKEANVELNKAREQAILSRDAHSLRIESDRASKRYFYITVDDDYGQRRRPCISLRYFDSTNSWNDQCTKLDRIRLKNINKDNIVDMIGIISGRSKMRKLKHLFPNLKPIPRILYFITAIILFWLLKTMFS